MDCCRIILTFPPAQELFMAEMQFDSGGGLHAVQPRPAGEGEGQQFGVIAEPLVILHALNSSE